MLVPAEVGRVRVSWGKSLWLWGMAVPGLVIGAPTLTAATAALAMALAFVTLCLGHSVGLHRGLIHRSYRASPIVRGALAYLAVQTGLGGPLTWIRFHAVRDYWQNQPACPRFFSYDHSLLCDLHWNLHLRFEPATRHQSRARGGDTDAFADGAGASGCHEIDDRAMHRVPAELLQDRWLRYLERTWPLHVGALAALLWLTLGPAAVASCICARVAAGTIGHVIITYAGHRWGDQRFVIPGASDSGRNVWLLGVLSFGEGFHNNHHAFPRSARMGLRRHELDLGWCCIWLMAKLRLVRDVRTS
jgi:fatty-acid desaturase